MDAKIDPIKGMSNLCILLSSSLAAHYLAGGSFVALPQFMTQMLVIGIIIWFFRSSILDGPALALIALFTQSGGHFILGGSDSTSDVQMVLSHFLAGFISYKLIRESEYLWELIRELAGSKLVFFRPLLNFCDQKTILVRSDDNQVCFMRFLESVKFRGPPSLREI